MEATPSTLLDEGWDALEPGELDDPWPDVPAPELLEPEEELPTERDGLALEAAGHRPWPMPTPAATTAAAPSAARVTLAAVRDGRFVRSGSLGGDAIHG